VANVAGAATDAVRMETIRTEPHGAEDIVELGGANVAPVSAQADQPELLLLTNGE